MGIQCFFDGSEFNENLINYDNFCEFTLVFVYSLKLY